MSQEDLWRLVGRARCDLDFDHQLKVDFEAALQDSGYQLDADERATAKDIISRLFADAAEGNVPMMPQSVPMSAADQAKMAALRMAQFERMDQFTAYMIETVKETFDHASFTYKTITLMNWLTFLTGTALFAFSAVYALVATSKEYSLLFAGLGASSFITSFVLRPPEKTQAALSNLVKTEIAFLSYFDQQSFWEGYANIPRGTPPAPDPANIEKASALLMERTRETLELLDRYVAAAKAGEPAAVTNDSV